MQSHRLIKEYSLSYKRKKSLGFTLIEVMVATLFLSMLALFAISAVKNQARQAAVNRAAIEMKMWLHAALAYYADTADWPDTLDDLGTDYYPLELICSPFLGSNSGKNCSGRSQYTGEPDGDDGKYFVVSLTVPDSTVAKTIASKLPSSFVTSSSGNKVTASVPVPGSLQGYITSAGIVSAQDMSDDPQTNRFSDKASRSFNIPPCDKGFKPHYIVNPAYFTTGFRKINDTEEMTAVYTGMSDLYQKNGRYYTFAFNNQITQAIHGVKPQKRDFNTYDNSSSVFDARLQRFAYFMTVCLPEGNWHVSSDASSLVNAMNTNGQQDLQSWDSNR